MRRRGNHPAELLFPCPLTVAAAAAVVVMWREKPAKKSAANWKGGGGAELAEGKQKQLGEKVRVCVGGHAAKS